MTTKLQHLIHPLITRSPPHNNFAVFHLSYPHKLEISMDRILELHNIELTKKTMLMQEQVFKQQVHELHRLYNLQKKLMQELENGLTRRNETTNPKFAVWLQSATQTGQKFQGFSARDDAKELNGSCSGESSKMPIKFDLQIPAEDDQQKDYSKRIDEETDVEVELTLSIGHCRRNQRSQSLQLHDSDRANQVQELGSSSTKTTKGEDQYGEPRSVISSSSSVYQENTRPHWLLQDLSLNRT